MWPSRTYAHSFDAPKPEWANPYASDGHIHEYPYVLHLCHCPSQTETGFLETQRNNNILDNKSLTIFNCIGINYGESHFDNNKIHAYIILQLNTCYGKHVTIHAII